MASGQLLNLYEDNDYYNKAMLFYYKLSDRNGYIDRYCQSVFNDDVVPKLNVTIPEGKELRTLGIGSGSGEHESHVLKQLLKKFPRISNHIVEPSTELATKYKTYVSANTADLQGIDYHWYEQILQKYKEDREKAAVKTKFHFVSALSCLYYFDNLGMWLDYLYDLLEDGGILMVGLGTDTGSMAHIGKEFPGLGSRDNFEYSEVSSANVQYHFDQRGIAHHTFIIDIPVDMTAMIDSESSEEGDLLVDFTSHIINFRKTADPELRAKFMKFMSEKCLKRVGERYIFTGDYGITVVQKCCN